MSKGEDAITGWFAEQSRLPATVFPIGIGDDMAEMRVGGSVLVTTDMLLEGVHFDLAEASLRDVAYKAMAVSLSDCAAMATRPVAAVAAVGLCKGWGEKELKEIHAGITAAGDRFGCKLIGGDITSWQDAGHFVINVTMLSVPGENEPVTRSGAKVGDRICVTGKLGGSIRGRHLTFEPRVYEAMAIAGMVEVHAMMDLSDGLNADIRRICKRSGVGAVIEAEKLPVSEAAMESDDAVGAALNDGEDFELLFTVKAEDCERLLSQWDGDVAITAVGYVTDTGKVEIKTADGEVRELKAGGYDHLR